MLRALHAFPLNVFFPRYPAAMSGRRGVKHSAEKTHYTTTTTTKITTTGLLLYRTDGVYISYIGPGGSAPRSVPVLSQRALGGGCLPKGKDSVAVYIRSGNSENTNLYSQPAPENG